MEVQMMGLDQIKPYAKNPRINDGAVEAVANSIKEFGFRQPIVVTSKKTIIAGHTRYLAAQKLGLEEVPVHVAKGLSAAQIKAYRLADNKTHELSDWDFELLPIELKELRDMEFDISSIGFSDDDLEPSLVDPPDDFPEYDENIPTEYECPKCHYTWSGSPK